MAESPTSPSPASAAIAEIDHGPSKFEQFLDENQNKLIALATLIAIGVIAYVIYDGIQEGKTQEAGSALVAADNTESLQAVINNWSGSPSAASAALLLAESQWKESPDEAISTLESFISSHPQHPAVATAKVNLGIKLHTQGKKDAAVEILSEVADNDNSAYIAPLACITLGDIAKESGDNSTATSWYEKAKNISIGDTPTEEAYTPTTQDEANSNSFSYDARIRSLLVNAKPPVKVQPALPEPPAVNELGLPEDLATGTQAATPNIEIPTPTLKLPEQQSPSIQIPTPSLPEVPKAP